VVCGGYGSPDVIENSVIRYSAYKFLLAFCIKYMYVPILHRFLDIARCWSKISDWTYPIYIKSLSLQYKQSIFFTFLPLIMDILTRVTAKEWLVTIWKVVCRTIIHLQTPNKMDTYHRYSNPRNSEHLPQHGNKMTIPVHSDYLYCFDTASWALTKATCKGYHWSKSPRFLWGDLCRTPYT